MVSLKQKAINGTKWSMIDKIVNTIVTFGISMVLARLLSPDDYGLLGLTSVTIVILTVFVKSGFSQSIIREQNIDNRDYSTIFYFNIAMCIFVYTILFFISPYIAIFFERPELVDILRVLGCGLIVSGFSLVPLALRVKEVNFKIQAQTSIIGNIIAGGIGIFLAFNNYGVWSLVVQHLISGLIYSLLLWYTSKWRPILYFSFDILKKHWNYSMHLLRTDIILALYSNIYYFAIGKFFSPSILGQFTKAEVFVNLLSKNIYVILGKNIAFPILCSVNENRLELQRLFVKFMMIISFVSFTLLSFFIAVSDSFIVIALGDQWSFTIKYVKILALPGILYPIKSFNIYITNVVGKTKIFANAVLFERILIIIGVVVGIVYNNILLMLWGMVFVSISSLVYNTIKVKKIINISYTKLYIDIVKQNTISFVVAVFTWILGVVLPYNMITTFIIQVMFGFSFLIIAFETSGNKQYLELKTIISRELKMQKL